MSLKLNLPTYEHKLRNSFGNREIFDIIRRKYVVLTPEEWVRQNFLRYLVEEKKIPRGLIGVEVSLTINSMAKRSDIVIYTREGKPMLAVECKAQHIKLTQTVFDQLARYNLALQVPYLVVTNGYVHYFCRYSRSEQTYVFEETIPTYSDLEKLL